MNPENSAGCTSAGCKPVTRTTCPYCGVGCGVEVKCDNSASSGSKFVVSGDKEHPANFGRLCSKGYALVETLGEDNRLTNPVVNNQPATWDVALDHIADEFQRVSEVHGPEAIGFYVSGQLLTEDYYVVNKFVKGYLGTANIDTNSRLCMASSVAGHKRAFGSDTVPGCYEDLDLADLIVLTGSNLAWCHPVLLRRIEAARESNPRQKIVVIDPRTTTTAEIADLHLPISAGGECDVLLFTGLLNYLVTHDAVDYSWVEEHTNDFLEARTGSIHWTPALVAEKTGLSFQKVEEFYQLFLSHKKVVTVYSQGVNQSCCGTDTVNSIINVHLATARIGKPGCGPFSVTGQPNAMGGREVGGLANMLAAHMDIENESHRDIVQRFWNSPRIAATPGLKAVELFKAVDAGKIKALWIMATNPVDSMPAGNVVARAIANCPFVVVSDVTTETDTVCLASVQLPALAWSEKDGTVTNSERRISRQRAFRTAPAEAKPDWWSLCEVAKRLGFEDGFTYNSVSAIYAEHAALSGVENHGSRDFDISAHADIKQQEYDALIPFQWPMPKEVTNSLVPNDPQISSRFFSNGGFYTPDGKARFINPASASVVRVEAIANARSVESAAAKASGELTVVLNTGRVRDQWHTMTRTGYIPKLGSHLGEPFIELSREDAYVAGIDDATLVDISSKLGRVTVRALLSDTVASGTAFAPMHWSNVFASNARVNLLVYPRTDSVSGQPALKSQLVKVAKSSVTSYGLLITRERLKNLKFLAYWAMVPIQHGWKVEFSSTENPIKLMQKISASAGFHKDDTELLSSHDEQQQYFNSCWFKGTELQHAVYLARHPVVVPRDQLANFLDKKYANFTHRLSALSGTEGSQQSAGAIVCSCTGVGKNTIVNAIHAGADTVTKVGTACNAGTQCGSCRPDLFKLLKTTAAVVSPQTAETCTT